jgi:6-methylsalicylate decarboxylase
MDSLNITKSIISISSPGTHLILGDDILARKVARDCNTFASALKARLPERFGFWASMPLPDVPGSLEELEFALDTLDADGVILQTNYHGRYLGHPSFEPLFAELNRRKTIIFIHPTSPCVARPDGSCYSAAPLTQFPAPISEFFFDSARAVLNLFISGTISRYPDITYIMSHAGGAFPPLVQRVGVAPSMIGLSIDISPEIIKNVLRRQFYFDLAGFPFPDQIKGLLPLAGPEQLLYGSDFCFTPRKTVAMLSDPMTNGIKELWPDEEVLEKIYYKNAQKLLALRGNRSTL